MPTPSPSVAAEPTYRPYPRYNPDPCYNSKDHDSADLCAQWRAAMAAEKTTQEARRATTWSIVATLFSFLTVVGLIVSLSQTQGALAEARRGNLIAQRSIARATRQAIANAASARKANEISERVVHAELRPYLFVEKLNLADVLDFNSKTQKIGQNEKIDYGSLVAKIEVHLRNAGKVPARNIRAYVKCYLAKFDRGQFWKFSFGVTPMNFCAPGHERRTFTPFLINAEERKSFDGGTLAGVVRLRITFEDDWGQVFTERAAFWFTGNSETFYLLDEKFPVGIVRKRWNEEQLALN